MEMGLENFCVDHTRNIVKVKQRNTQVATKAN